MENKIIIIQYDFHNGEDLLSFVEVKDSIEKQIPVIKTNCLEFFSFSSLNKGYDVKVLKSNGSYILLSELLENKKEYTMRQIRKGHNLRKLLVANEFIFKGDK